MGENMTFATNLSQPKLQYHPNAYDFIFEALQQAQDIYTRPASDISEQEEAHVSGQELLEGVLEQKPETVVFKVLRGIHTLFIEIEPQWTPVA